MFLAALFGLFSSLLSSSYLYSILNAGYFPSLYKLYIPGFIFGVIYGAFIFLTNKKNSSSKFFNVLGIGFIFYFTYFLAYQAAFFSSLFLLGPYLGILIGSMVGSILALWLHINFTKSKIEYFKIKFLFLNLTTVLSMLVFSMFSNSEIVSSDGDVDVFFQIVLFILWQTSIFIIFGTSEQVPQEDKILNLNNQATVTNNTN